MSLFVGWWVMSTFIAIWKVEYVKFIISMFTGYVYVHCSFEKTLYKLYHFYILGLCLCLWDVELYLHSLQFENYNVYNLSYLCLWGYVYVCCISMSTFICFMYTYLYELCLRSLQFEKDSINFIISMFMGYVYICDIMSYVYAHCSSE